MEEEKEVKEEKKVEEKEIKEEVKEEKKEENEPVKEEKKKTGKKSVLKIVIFCVIGFIALIIFLVLFTFVINPMLKYNSAKSSFEKKDYENAITIYTKLGKYGDSEEQLKNTYFVYGKQIINDGKEDKYATAIDMFKKSGKSIDWTNYAIALNDLKDGKYDDAITLFDKLGDFEKSKEFLKKTYFMKGESLFAKKEYEKAKESYEKADDYEGASKMVTASDFMVAETAYKEGSLAKAKALYSKLPAIFEYEGVKVSDRLDTLDKYSIFVALSGNWSGSNGKYVVKEVYQRDYSWESWSNVYSSSLDIKCIINDDGSVKITGDTAFYTYKNYSTLSYALQSDSVKVPISKTIPVGSINKVPSSLVSNYPAMIAANGTVGYVNLTYAKNKITLNFKLNDKNYSQWFAHVFTSTITFTKKSN